MVLAGVGLAIIRWRQQQASENKTSLPRAVWWTAVFSGVTAYLLHLKVLPAIQALPDKGWGFSIETILERDFVFHVFAF